VPPTNTVDQPPVFGTTPPNPGSATVGLPFRYNAIATDPELDYPLTFDLPVHPRGMVIDPSLGVVAWTPTADQATGASPGAGTYSVLLRVTDTKGSVALQSFTINVLAESAPVITSTPPTQIGGGSAYQYQVTAQDAEHDTLTYSLTAAPTGMTVNAGTGLVYWSSSVVGSYSITVQVSDGRGGIATQSYSLSVIDPGIYKHKTPSVTSSPPTQIALGQTYEYLATATIADGTPLTFSLTTKPTGMTVNAVPGYANAAWITWTPSASQVGSNSVTLSVNSSVTQSWTITVGATAVNGPPSITSTPGLEASVGTMYAYNLTGTDPHNYSLNWKLLSGPNGMSVDPNLGTLRWLPLWFQAPTQSVTVQAVNSYGDLATQSWTIAVEGVNLPPVITSEPVMVCAASAFYYQVQASDPDGDALQYSFSASPIYMTISSTGLLTDTIRLTAGTYPITVTVSDGPLSTNQSWTLTVLSTLNYAPVITSNPVLGATTTSAYSYQATATDRDGDTQTWSLSTTYTGSGGPTISTAGLVNWTSPVAGNYLFTVTDTDAGGLIAIQTYGLSVAANVAPTITSTAPSTLTLGLPYRYDVIASDTDGDALSYALSGTVPTGMTIDQNGRITWTPTATGTYSGITVTATDPYSASASQTFSVTVSADTTPPNVELQYSPTAPAIGTTETFVVQATDDVAIASETLTVNGTNLSIDSKGQAFYTISAAGTYTVAASAKDAGGNTTTKTVTLTVTNPTGTPPTISLTAPSADANITALTSVTGTITDDHVGISYTVTVIPFDGSASFQLASGSTTTANTLTLSNVTFDPTMLANGDYTIEVKATDTDDNLTTTLDRHVSVSAKLKLGRETLSVTDLTIPVAGVPLTITRSYDSLEAGKSFDFGFGWRLTFGDAKLKVDLAPSSPAPASTSPCRVVSARASPSNRSKSTPSSNSGLRYLWPMRASSTR
jgi:hypothetical protein